MKVCILSAVNIKHMSLITLYTEILKKQGIEYDIIYMDKYGEDEYFECAHKYRYVNVVKQSWLRLIKGYKYMTFLGYAKKILNREKYDFVIVWNDVAIFMFADYLPRKYKGKYCLNVRDNMHYDEKLYQPRYQKEFENAAFCTTSSLGYLDFLPKGIDYVPVHSFNLSVLEGMQRHTGLRQEGEPIRIGFIGYVRYFERNKKLLKTFANDPRFELHYYGKKADVLREYAEAEGIKNTVFHDSFPVEQTKDFMENIDVINNLYGNDTLNVRKAISIKYFHALYAKVPVLVCPDTYVGQLAKEAGIGFEVDDDRIDAQMKDDLYNWYRGLDFAELEKNCEARLQQATEENGKFREMVCSYLK